MRRVPLWLTGLGLVLAVGACEAGGGHPAATASHAGQTGRGLGRRALERQWLADAAVPAVAARAVIGNAAIQTYSARDAWVYHYSNGQWSRQAAPALGGQATEMGVLSWRPGARSGWAAAYTGTWGALLRYFP